MNPEINEIEVLNIKKDTMYLHEGVLYVNSLALPPLNSEPVKCHSIVIVTNPTFNVWSEFKLIVNYLINGTSTSNTSPK
jgi:hypothetical protein